MYVTRFAPSPTGLLHLGNAFSAMTGWRRARERGGKFLLRIEDIDAARCRPAFEDAIYADLRWLGIDWDGPVWRQSERMHAYAAALDRLRDMGLVYRCWCSRADIAAAGGAPQGEQAVYPGTCRGFCGEKPGQFAWRFDVTKASAMAGPLSFVDATAGKMAVDALAGGDVVVGRRDSGVSYHLAVVVDDAAQGVTEVVRGADLFAATHVQRLLQAVLGLPEPGYFHHRLVVDEAGRRLAKRDGDATVAGLRGAGVPVKGVLGMMG